VNTALLRRKYRRGSILCHTAQETIHLQIKLKI
jgi:hypothetical protein